jgi:hypothetical protein
MFSLKNRRVAVALLLSLFFAGACTEKQSDRALYNIDSLVSFQINTLTELRATLQKEAFVGTSKDDTVFIPKDSASWNDELAMFRALDQINKPINRSSYIVDDSLFDPSSNLTVKAISSINNLPVKYVRIFYDEDMNRPRKIEALYDDKNQMYATGKVMTMEFQNINSRHVLTSYMVQGGQKMFMGDSVTYVIKGKIVVR